MKTARAILAPLLIAVLLCALCGCTSIFKKDYLSVSTYVDDAHSADSDMTRVSDYGELKNALIQMFNNHETEGRLKFTDYDGSLQNDIMMAYQEVKASNALASYAVNYISYDPSPIATYYEAAIYISYKHSESEISDIRFITGRSKLNEAFGEILSDLDTYAALRMTSATITVDEVKQAVYSAFAVDPASCVVMPELTVELHPESGVQRIIELKLDYGLPANTLKKLRSELTDKLYEISGGLSKTSEAAFALGAYNALAKGCEYDALPPAADAEGSQLSSDYRSTAYGALAEGKADSLGIALAYCALCRTEGIECVVVTGTLDGEGHCWNIVKIDQTYYHVDVSGYGALGLEKTFMRSDQQMGEKYAWDAASYPVCNGVKAYSTAVPSPEAS